MNNLSNKDVLVGIFSYNNGIQLENTINRISPDFPYDFIIHIDGSTDGSDNFLMNRNYNVIRSEINKGIGGSLKNFIQYAISNHYSVIALLPGNNKNNPNEIINLVDEIVKNDYDYVQGSRYLKGAKRDHTPIFRLIMVRVHALLFSILTFRKCTDALEGVRAYKLSIFDGTYINIWQDWLNAYECETYIHFKVLKNKKFKVIEVPSSKVYPQNKKSIFNNGGVKYSHIIPFISWWSILRPIFFLFFKIKK